jgi:hypothetical protein
MCWEGDPISYEDVTPPELRALREELGRYASGKLTDTGAATLPSNLPVAAKTNQGLINALNSASRRGGYGGYTPQDMLTMGDSVGARSPWGTDRSRQYDNTNTSGGAGMATMGGGGGGGQMVPPTGNPSGGGRSLPIGGGPDVGSLMSPGPTAPPPGMGGMTNSPTQMGAMSPGGGQGMTGRMSSPGTIPSWLLSYMASKQGRQTGGNNA